MYDSRNVLMMRIYKHVLVPYALMTRQPKVRDVIMQQTTPTLLVEVFPVQLAAIPPLVAYQLQVRGGDLATMGGKLAYRLQRIFKGHWLWTERRIVTDSPQPDEALKPVIVDVWSEQPAIFQGLLAIQRDILWRPTAQVLADFVARALFRDLQPEVNQVLASLSHDLGRVRIHRACDVRGWVLREEPAISISVISRLLARQDLKTYARQVATPEHLIGLVVADKLSGSKGEIAGITGTVGEHRERLLALTQRDESRAIIQRAADHEPVVHVRMGRNAYDFVASALGIVVNTATYARFGIDAKQATNALRLSPQDRLHMLVKIRRIFTGRNVIGTAYRSNTAPTLFLNATDVNFSPGLLLGGGHRVSGEKTLQANLHRYGFYKRGDAFPEGTPVRIAVLNAVPGALANQFLPRLQQELQALKFASTISQIETVRGTSRDALERTVNQLQMSTPHLQLALFPDGSDEAGEDEGQWGVYHHFKSLTVGMGIPSQVVTQSTMSNQYALANIALGLLSKIGNVPYVLAEPLPYADILVGIDIARRKKERLSGSVNATAIARVYQGNGEFLQYALYDAPLEGETIPSYVLQALFPQSVFAGKRVLVHRDGLFRGEEKQALKEWGKRLRAEFHLVELLKTGAPRLYGVNTQTQGAQLPLKGSALRLNDHEAFLVSSLPPFANATPYPLHIRTEASFGIEEAIHSVLALTLLHYGSLRPPRLPITIHYSDEIAYLALKGIKPKEMEGTLPFWL
jgi:Piwi domain